MNHCILTDIRIDWRVFNHIPNDDKLIDLITFIGQPFPRLTEDIVAECEETIPPSPLVRAIIQPHEGVQSSGYPFTMDQQQIVNDNDYEKEIHVHVHVIVM